MINTLVIGKGGREHAIIQALKQSASVKNVYSFPGRDGFNTKPITDDSKKTLEQLIPIIKEQKIDLVIIGPEQELTEGWSDQLRQHGVLVFGPSQEASQLEGSKIYAKKFMKDVSIPTAHYVVVKSVHQTMEQSKNFKPPYVLKADGLAGGKGVFICPDSQTLKDNAQKLFEEKVFGEQQALLEEFQEGSEISIFILTNGEDYTVLPIAQDFKKLKENNQGPNTGGMGALAPISIDKELMNQIQEQILKPTVNQMKNKNLFYRGVLYIGIIKTPTGPKVLEYNVRFGDPECQVLLPLLNTDMGELFSQIAKGQIPSVTLKNIFSCCVVLAEKGYPSHVQKGEVIHDPKKVLSSSSHDSSYFLHAGTKKSNDDSWIVDGGRVLNAIGLGNSPSQARQHAYDLIQSLNSELYYRKDIS